MRKVLLKAPLLTQSGYGHHGRTILRALRTREDIFDIYLQAINWGHTSWQWEDNDERRWVDQKLQETIDYVREGGQFDMSLQVSIPNEWEKIAPVNIGITAGIETTKVAPHWIEKSAVVDKILTISEHSKNVYKNTVYEAKNELTGERRSFRCETPIEYVSYPVEEVEPVDLDLKLETDFNFLSVVQISPRKNIFQTLKAFVEEFKDEENVGLVLKSNLVKNSLIDRINTLKQLKNFLSNYEDRKCKIYLLHGCMKDEEMAGLYTHPKIKAFISTTHGEGFGLPIFESAYHGLPIIATDWSGHLDFLYKPTKSKNKKKHMFNRISYTLQPVEKEVVWEGVITADSMWAYPEDGSIKMNMREVYKDYGRFKKRAKELKTWVCEEFNKDKQLGLIVDFLHNDEEYDLEQEMLNNIDNILKDL